MGYSKKAAIGIGWMGGLKVVIRAIGFIKLFVLARILVPNDFGLFGIAALALAFLEIFTETGINVFFIQSKDENVLKKYINTAWVISIFRGILMFAVIFILAGPISVFFNAPESKNLLIIISFVPLFKGFINPSIIKFQKGLEFKKEFLLRSLLILIESIVSIGYAIIYSSATALVIGIFVSAIFEVFFSLTFMSPKPKFKFELDKFKEIVSKGKWVTLNGLTGFLTMQGDDAVVGKILGATQLGFYNVAYKFAILPGTEVSETVTRVVFPTFSKFSDDIKRLRKAYYKSLLLTAFLSLPLGLVLVLFPSQVLEIVVGKEWLAATETLRVLSIYGMFGAILGTRNSVLYAVGRQDIASRISTVKLLVLIATIYPLVIRYGILGAAYSALLTVIAAVPMTIYYLRKILYEK